MEQSQEKKIGGMQNFLVSMRRKIQENLRDNDELEEPCFNQLKDSLEAMQVKINELLVDTNFIPRNLEVSKK